MRVRLFTDSRRLLIAGVAVVVVVVLTGCRPGDGGSPASTTQPPSAIAIEQPLPASTLTLVADNLRTSSLKGQKLTVKAKFESSGHFTVLATTDGKVLVSVGVIQSTAGFLTELSGSAYSVPLMRHGQAVTLAATANVRPADERLMMFVATDNLIRSIRRDLGDPDTVTAFTVPGRSGYVGSFVPDTAYSGPLKIGKDIPPGVRAVFVEVCQNMLRLELPATEKAKLTASAWKGQADYATLGAQETVCNSLGVAAAVAHNVPKVSYAEYKAAVAQRAGQTRTVAGDVVTRLLLIDEVTYNKFAG